MHLRETAEDVDEAISAAEELLTSLRLLVIEVWSHITSRKTQRMNKQKKTRGGGGVLNTVLCQEASSRGPTAHPFIHHFWQESEYSFRFVFLLLLTNGTPCTYL